MASGFDFEGRLRRIRSLMEEEDVDVLVATRLMSVCYVSGAFIPYRAAAMIPREGDVELYPSLIESERIREESWIKNINPWAPIPGLNWTEQVAERIKALGLEKARIGVESEITPRLIEGVIT
nr:hypothetical protein [Candidatus Bathyarchaeota archaeon]